MVNLAMALLLIVAVFILIGKYGDSVVDWVYNFIGLNKDNEVETKEIDDGERSILEKKMVKLKELRQTLKDIELEQDVTEELKKVEDRIESILFEIEEIDRKRK